MLLLELDIALWSK